MSRTGLIMTVLGVCVSGSIADVHTGDVSSSHGFKSHLKQFFRSIIVLTHIIL